MDDLRPSPIAGRWYPAQAAALRQAVDGYLDAAALPEDGAPPAERIIGLLAPHAGLMYSGPVAAHAFRALGQALARVLAGQRALVVASSDLSHFYPQAQAERMDAQMLAPLAALDPRGVLAAQASGRGQACGPGAIAAMLWAAQALGAQNA